MRVIKNAAAFVILVITLSSCQKELSQDTDTPIVAPVSVSAQPKKYIEDIKTSAGEHTSTTYNLSYDATGRITGIVDSATPGNKFLYQYTSANSYTLDIYNANLVVIHEVFFVNSLSLVDSSFQYNDTKDSMTEKYTYDSSKQLVKLNQYTYSKATGAVLDETHNYSYDSNGNQIKDDDGSDVLTYDYYTNLENNLSLGQIYFYANKNLVKTTTYVSGGQTYSASHAYIFDSQNRLSSEKAITSNGDTVIKTYIY